MLRRFFSSFYDSQSGKFIRHVKPKIFDLSLLRPDVNPDIMKKMNKDHTIVVPSISNIKKIIDNNFNNISAISQNVSDINDIITYNNVSNTNIEATFLVTENHKELKDMILYANKNNIITTSVMKLKGEIDLYRLSDFNANLADWECRYILLHFDKVEEDLIREIIENSFNIDCENEPMHTRLGVFGDLTSIKVAKSMSVMHFAIES